MEIQNTTNLRFKRSTQMAHTPTRKPELGSIVRKQFCITLHAFRCLHKHFTGAPSSYTPLLVLGPAPHDPRVHKPTIRETRMTRVVNGVRHTTLSDAILGVIVNDLPSLREKNVITIPVRSLQDTKKRPMPN
jgi:hypothetical protein